MAEPDKPPFRQKQWNQENQDHWFPPKPVRDSDLQKIHDDAKKDGAREAMDDPKAVVDQNLTFARAKRDRPELTEAITIALHGDSVSRDKAWERAGLILGKVNTWLEKHGLESANQKSIYDRIVRGLRT
jgi:hypothetical protein